MSRWRLSSADGSSGTKPGEPAPLAHSNDGISPSQSCSRRRRCSTAPGPCTASDERNPFQRFRWLSCVHLLQSRCRGTSSADDVAEAEGAAETDIVLAGQWTFATLKLAVRLR